MKIEAYGKQYSRKEGEILLELGKDVTINDIKINVEKTPTGENLYIVKGLKCKSIKQVFLIIERRCLPLRVS